MRKWKEESETAHWYEPVEKMLMTVEIEEKGERFRCTQVNEEGKVMVLDKNFERVGSFIDEEIGWDGDRLERVCLEWVRKRGGDGIEGNGV